MADNERQENTTRRSRVEDANYIPTSDEPKLPRVRETPAPGAGLTRALLVFGIVLLVLTAAGLASRGKPGREEALEIRFAAAGERTERAADAVLGMEVGDISAPVAAYYRAKGRDLTAGVGVFTVDPDGPARELRPGDVICAVNGEAISAAAELEQAASAASALTLTVLRDGEYLELSIAPGG